MVTWPHIVDIQHLDTLAPIWKHADADSRIFGTVVVGVSNTRYMQCTCSVCICPDITVWYNSITLTWGTVGLRIAVFHYCRQFLWISLLSNANLAIYIGHVFGDGIDGKYASFRGINLVLLIEFTNSPRTFTGRVISSACASSRMKNQHNRSAFYPFYLQVIWRTAFCDCVFFLWCTDFLARSDHISFWNSLSYFLWYVWCITLFIHVAFDRY